MQLYAHILPTWQPQQKRVPSTQSAVVDSDWQTLARVHTLTSLITELWLARSRSHAFSTAPLDWQLQLSIRRLVQSGELHQPSHYLSQAFKRDAAAQWGSLKASFPQAPLRNISATRNAWYYSQKYHRCSRALGLVPGWKLFKRNLGPSQLWAGKLSKKPSDVAIYLSIVCWLSFPV